LKTFITAVALAAAFAVAGCGDDKKSDSGSNGALSYSEFDKQANAICKENNDKTKPLSSKFTGSAQNDAPLFDTAVPAIKDGVAKFKELKPPPELQSTFDEFTASADQQIAATATAQSAAKTGDDAAYQQALKELQKIGQEGDVLASKLGAVECTK
jgi:hypothetical protein